MTKILYCGCRHEWQDSRYGAGLRVMNRKASVGASPRYRCTVCESVRGV